MIIIDDFIEDESLLNEITTNKDTFFGPNGNFMWWEGWWNGRTNSLKHRLIEYIWKDNSPAKSYNAVGFEYWTGVYGPDKPNKDLGGHYDKDELQFQRTGEIVRPVIGTVFYPMDVDFEGGVLEIEHENGDLEYIQAKYNRFIIFEAGSKVHRVTPVTKGTRKSFVLWLGGGHFK
jgi:hypothetical protein